MAEESKRLFCPRCDRVFTGPAKTVVENLKKHIENIHRFGLPVVVAINHFSTDTDEEIQFIKDKCAYLSVQIVTADHWARGGAGAEELAAPRVP